MHAFERRAHPKCPLARHREQLRRLDRKKRPEPLAGPQRRITHGLAKAPGPRQQSVEQGAGVAGTIGKGGFERQAVFPVLIRPV